MNGELPPYDVNLRACSRIMNLMSFIHNVKYRPSSNHGDADYFCYKIMPLEKFPFKVETPAEYNDSKIRTSLFQTETQNGPVFKSPTLSDFEWMKRKKKGYINDNSLPPSHILNFWSNPWHVWEKSRHCPYQKMTKLSHPTTFSSSMHFSVLSGTEL